jgi:hypothetical protein
MLWRMDDDIPGDDDAASVVFSGSHIFALDFSLLLVSSAKTIL